MKIKNIGRTRLNSISTLLNQLTATACGILIPRFLIGAFGSETYGITVSITQFLSYIALLESGIGGVARARLYGPLARGDMGEVSAVYHAEKRFFRWVAVAFAVYSIVLGVFFRDIAHVVQYSRGYLFALVIVISLATLAKYTGGLANLTLIVADQRHYFNNAVSIATTVANTIAIIVIVNLKCDILWVKLGSSLIFIARPLLYSIYVHRRYRLPRVQEAVLDQKWTGIGQHIAYFLHTNTDVVLLTVLADVRLVAVYSVYSLIVSSIRAITQSISGSMEGVFGEQIAKGQLDALRRSFRNYQGVLTTVCLVLFTCTGILILPFVRLYTAGVTDAEYLQPGFALVLLTAEAINCLMLPCASLPIAANHLRQTRAGAYGEALINIVLSCVLIWWKPLLGVALGTLAATAFRGVYYTVYSAKHYLHVQAHTLLLRSLGAVAALLAGICAGRALLRSAVIESFYQWVLWGVVTFVCVAALAAVIGRRFLKNARESGEHEEDPDRE